MREDAQRTHSATPPTARRRETPNVDLSAERTYAEAVAYGKALAVRELLDELAKDRPAATDWQGARAYFHTFGRPDRYWRDDYVRGYDRARRIVQGYRCGVEK